MILKAAPLSSWRPKADRALGGDERNMVTQAKSCVFYLEYFAFQRRGIQKSVTPFSLFL